jgi:predicted flap endonuclease-1-like 5' DNA nuclease
MPGAGTRASRLAIGAPAPAAAPAPKATAPAAVAAPEATAEPTPAEGPAEVSEHEGAGSPDAGKPEAAGEHMRPAGLDAPRGGAPDDLKKIKGVGPKLEKLVHAMGYYHFDQIAAWSSAEIAWVDDNLEGFKGRVTRDEWVSQAAILAVVGETGLATEG